MESKKVDKNLNVLSSTVHLLVFSIIISRVSFTHRTFNKFVCVETDCLITNRVTVD